MWDLVARYDDRSARAVCSLAVADLRPQAHGDTAAAPAPAPATPILLFRGELAGGCVAPRGDVRHGARSWNSVFVPAGGERTFGEMSYEEQSGMSHRHAALAAFVRHVGAGAAAAQPLP